MARLFYGNNALASGISAVQVGNAIDWLTTDFLRLGEPASPSIASARVLNHSWVGALNSATANARALHRIDWLVQQGNVINVVAMNNGSSDRPLLGSSYNSIAVGMTSGNHLCRPLSRCCWVAWLLSCRHFGVGNDRSSELNRHDPLFQPKLA